MAWVEHHHVDADALAAAVARQLADSCGDAIVARGHALLALAGGRTPLPVYRQLADAVLRWRDVTAMPTDERCVPHDHPACNVAGLRAAFAAADGIVIDSLTTTDGEPARSLAHARAMLAGHPMPFDAVVLGMGGDAHTASLFPGAEELAVAIDPAAAQDAYRIDPLPLPAEAPFPRITLSAARLLRARSLYLLATGAAKRDVLRQAQRSSDPLRHPIAAMLHAEGTVVYIHWSP
jgi:6-phosphogluconolactonase